MHPTQFAHNKQYASLKGSILFVVGEKQYTERKKKTQKKNTNRVTPSYFLYPLPILMTNGIPIYIYIYIYIAYPLALENQLSIRLTTL